MFSIHEKIRGSRRRCAPWNPNCPGPGGIEFDWREMICGKSGYSSPRCALKERLGLAELHFDYLIVFRQFEFLAVTLTMIGRDQQTDGSLWNAGELVASLSVGLGGVSVALAAPEFDSASRFIELQGQAGLVDGLCTFGFFHDDGKICALG